MKNKPALYGVIFEFQKEEIRELCWGSECGKGHIGALDIGRYTLVTCGEKVCPFSENQTEKPITEYQGHDLFLRKIVYEST